MKINGDSANIEDVQKITSNPRTKITIEASARKKMLESRKYIEKEVEKGEIIYGVNTGFGALSSVHISENDRGIPGTGHNDWKGILKMLKEIGYDGWLTIESFAQPEPALAAAAAIWRDLAPSGDDLARQGLQFTKGLARKLGIH